jgi:hypothetical protein
MSQKFHQRFNIEVGLDEARRRFINRAHNVIAHDILDKIYEHDGLEEASEVERYVCTKLGEQWRGYGCLSSIIGDNFFEHVRALEAFYEHSKTRTWADHDVKQILADSEIDLGIRWNNGHFLPSGSQVLDEKLVNDVLGSLSSKEYGGVLAPFQKGLEYFLRSINKPETLADVVRDMYESLEALAKIVTGNGKDLSANSELFISRSKISDEYKPILKAYISYANEFRHAADKGQKKAPPSRKEVESFIYLTGLFIRLATF